MTSVNVPLHGRDRIVAVAVVDEADIHLVDGMRWFIDRNRYAWCHTIGGSGKPTTIKMHRLLMDAPAGMDVDHINGDTLDNRRCNLRLCTHAQNMMNHRGSHARSGYRGVRLMPSGSYHARITHHRKDIHLGAFRTPEEAWLARRAAEERLRGEFAPSC